MEMRSSPFSSLLEGVSANECISSVLASVFLRRLLNSLSSVSPIYLIGSLCNNALHGLVPHIVERPSRRRHSFYRELFAILRQTGWSALLTFLQQCTLCAIVIIFTGSNDRFLNILDDLLIGLFTVYFAASIQVQIGCVILDLIHRICLQHFPKVENDLLQPLQKKLPSGRLAVGEELEKEKWMVAVLKDAAVLLYLPARLFFGLHFRTTVLLTMGGLTAVELAVLCAFAYHKAALRASGLLLKVLLEWTDWNPFLDMEPRLYEERIAAATTCAPRSQQSSATSSDCEVLVDAAGDAQAGD